MREERGRPVRIADHSRNKKPNEMKFQKYDYVMYFQGSRAHIPCPWCQRQRFALLGLKQYTIVDIRFTERSNLQLLI